MIATLKKINYLITNRQRRGLVYLTLLLFIGMIINDLSCSTSQKLKKKI